MIIRTVLATAAVTAGLLSGAGTSAEAQTPGTMRPASVQQVCAQDVYVRQTAAGVVIGTLRHGESFDHTGGSATWWYGYAYGSANKWGYVLASAFSGC
jgi:hypothetical protein